MASGQHPGPWDSSAIYTAPGSSVVIVKSIHFDIQTASTAWAWRAKTSAGAFADVLVAGGTSSDPLTAYRWDGWLVLEPGDYLYVMAAYLVDYWISGAVLLE